MKLPELSEVFTSSVIRTLADMNINNLNDFSRYTHTEIEELHGIGKKAIIVIDSELKSNNVEYKDESDNPEVTEYIDQYEGTTKKTLLEIRCIIRKAIPKAHERMTYRMPTYYYIENLVHFAGFKTHIGIYPTPQGIEVFKDKLKGYKTSKGAIQIPINERIPEKMIKDIAEYRYREVIA